MIPAKSSGSPTRNASNAFFEGFIDRALFLGWAGR